VYTGTQSIQLSDLPGAAPHGHAAAAASPAPPREAEGRFEVTEEGGGIRLAMPNATGGMCTLTATGTAPSFAISADQSCADTTPALTVTLHIQEGTAHFEGQTLTVEFHGTRDRVERHGHHETHNAVTFHFTGQRTGGASAAPATSAPGAADTEVAPPAT
jgi:hypothetical protein